MKIQYMMSCPARSAAPTETLEDAAAVMADYNVGALPVVDEGHLVGIVTDRDLAVRGFAAGLDAGAHLVRVMTAQPVTCSPDDELAEVLAVMGRRRIRRMPVCTADGDLVGVVSLADAARQPEYRGEAAETLSEICRPETRHGKGERAVLLAQPS